MLMLGAAAAATVAEPPMNKQLTASFMAEQMQRGQLFLYTSCICLTVGVIYSAVWLRWPIELMPPGSLRNELAAYVSIVVAVIGVVASFLILSTYLPMALIQRGQTRELARTTLLKKKRLTEKGVPVGFGDQDIAMFLEANCLRIPLISQFQRVGAILLPALVSPLISAIGSLTTTS